MSLENELFLLFHEFAFAKLGQKFGPAMDIFKAQQSLDGIHRINSTSLLELVKLVRRYSEPGPRQYK